MKNMISKSKLLILVLFSWPMLGIAGQANFALPDLNGKIHHLSDYRGKWVVVNYWATWCPPCRAEIPELEDFYQAHHNKDAIVVGINYEDSEPADLRKFVDENMISYPILRAELGRQSTFGQLYGLPTSYIISPQGKLVETKTGAVSREYLENAIRQQTTKVVSTK